MRCPADFKYVELRSVRSSTRERLADHLLDPDLARPKDVEPRRTHHAAHRSDPSARLAHHLRRIVTYTVHHLQRRVMDFADRLTIYRTFRVKLDVG